MYMYMCMCMCTCVYGYGYVYVRVHVYGYMDTLAYMRDVCMCMHAYMNTYIHEYIHSYTYVRLSSRRMQKVWYAGLWHVRMHVLRMNAA
jgi:hypothetical protein